jgi:peptide-methionine (S)-S-oxide reductase
MLATFAAGCFWGVEEAFLSSGKVLATLSGYSGGNVSSFPKPSYEQVCTGKTGYAEAVQITFNPEQTCYSELLDIFWKCHDPTQMNRQGPDVGTQYRSAIFCHDIEQQRAAESSKAKAQQSSTKPITTAITLFETFHPAEEYHQKYFRKHPERQACHF